VSGNGQAHPPAPPPEGRWWRHPSELSTPRSRLRDSLRVALAVAVVLAAAAVVVIVVVAFAVI